MTEERVTKSILQWLQDTKWKIISYDFPQSGTGKLLHHNNERREKNKSSIIPDIIAVKNDVCIIFENKDRYVYADYVKIANMKKENCYSKSLNIFLTDYKISNIFYGIGLPALKHSKKAEENSKLVDFVVGVNEDLTADIFYDSKKIFS